MRYVVLLAGLVLAACGGTADPTPVSVTSRPGACDIMPDSAPAGTVVLSVRNAGRTPTSFSVSGPDGTQVGELPELTAGEAKDLVLQLSAGSYTVTCDQIRSTLRVT